MRISILVNSSPYGYFGCSRGVCQGDPLSTLLFILAKDLLSRYLSNMVTLVDQVLMSSKHSINAPSHFLYTDDVLLFARASVSNLTNIMEAFRLYGSLFGQDVNWEKSFIYFGKGVPYGVASSLLNLSPYASWWVFYDLYWYSFICWSSYVSLVTTYSA